MEEQKILSGLFERLNKTTEQTARWLANILPITAPLELPSGVRVPFGWTACGISSEQTISLNWSHNNLTGTFNSFSATQRAIFRISVALDVREVKKIEVKSSRSQKLIGYFDIRYAHVLQPFELVIPPDVFTAFIEEGCTLRLVGGTSPLWIFVEPDGKPLSGTESATGYLPHLIFETISVANNNANLEQSLLNLMSLSSVQQWGWMEGIILDSLYDLSQIDAKTPARGEQTWEASNDFPKKSRQALLQHLALFVQNERLIYEDPRSRPCDGQIYGIEATLPFAVLAKLNPHAQIVTTVCDFWLTQATANKLIIDEDMVSAEGCYTVAYPLAVVARQLNKPELAQLAIVQLLERKRRLFNSADSKLYLRSYNNGQFTFPNWGRAWAWYLLGLVRTLIEVQATNFALDKLELAALKDECKRAIEQVAGWQLPNGLWRCFVDDTTTDPDISGSLGIATAIGLANHHELVETTYHQKILLTFSEVQNYLSADGYLRGIAQSNKAGEDLQRSDYRVISPMALGLLGQLVATLI